MSFPSPRLDLSVDQGVVHAAFVAGVVQRGLGRVQRRFFPIGEITSEQLASLGVSVEMSDEGAMPINLLVQLEEGPLGLLTLYPQQAALAVAAQERGQASTSADRLVNALRSDPPVSDDFVPMTFWSLSGNGPRPLHRLIRAPRWDDIEANYALGAREAVDDLMEASEPRAGRLVIWQGAPGTGKTYALRALARAWRDWCDVNVIVDPEVFFGHQTSYLMDVLFTAAQGGAPDRARLLVMEDSGELLSADAREAMGQALSRLLNVSDGLLGQGLDLYTLITTNEPIERFHPAVSRPGRCWAQITFPALPPDQANAWLAAHDSSARVEAPTALAELYEARR